MIDRTISYNEIQNMQLIEYFQHVPLDGRRIMRLECS